MVHGTVTDRHRITPDDDLIQPFQLDVPKFRGRFVRLGPALDEILSKHDYPDAVARLLGEALALAAALSGALKYEGIFTLQTKGDGPVSMLVADVTSTGDLRGYASYDADAIARFPAEVRGEPDIRALIGTGYIAFTVDQGEHTERYQGIVELRGARLADAAQHYFRQSEQLVTGLSVAADRVDGRWRAGALMLQRLAEGAANLAPGEIDEDDWRRSMLLMGTVTDGELVSAALSANEVLFRLFHEEEVRVYAPHRLRHACRCSRERVETVLVTLPEDDVEHMKVDGVITATCQFCSAAYTFTDADVAKLRG
jgi:molecular chaperone Hsp33